MVGDAQELVEGGGLLGGGLHALSLGLEGPEPDAQGGVDLSLAARQRLEQLEDRR